MIFAGMPDPSSAPQHERECGRQRGTDREWGAVLRPAKKGQERRGTASGIGCVQARWALLDFAVRIALGSDRRSKTDAGQLRQYMRVKRLSKTFRLQFNLRSRVDALPNG